MPKARIYDTSKGVYVGRCDYYYAYNDNPKCLCVDVGDIQVVIPVVDLLKELCAR